MLIQITDRLSRGSWEHQINGEITILPCAGDAQLHILDPPANIIGSWWFHLKLQKVGDWSWEVHTTSGSSSVLSSVSRLMTKTTFFHLKNITGGLSSISDLPLHPSETPIWSTAKACSSSLFTLSRSTDSFILIWDKTIRAKMFPKLIPWAQFSWNCWSNDRNDREYWSNQILDPWSHLRTETLKCEVGLAWMLQFRVLPTWLVNHIALG